MAIDETQLRDLIAKREAAEKAVEGADPAIKEKAFEVAFQHLLTAGTQPAAKRGSRRRKRARETAREQPAPRRPRRSSGPQGHLRDLLDDGFFDERRDLPAVVQQLRVVGHNYTQENLSTPLRRLTQARVLRREQEERDDGRKIWVYERYK